MQVEEALVVEELVDGKGQVVTDAEHGAKGIGAHAQVSLGAQELQRVAFLLHGIVVGTGAVNLDALGLDLNGLALALRLDEQTLDVQAGACSDGTQLLLAELLEVNDNLQVVDGRSVVQCDELDELVSTAAANPALDTYLLTHQCGIKDINDFCSFQCHCCLFDRF